MKYQAFVRAAATVLAASALLAGNAALAADPSSTAPTPERMSDVGPPPASERNSIGAIILADEPVLAQREYLEMLARQGIDTRVMGAGPNKLLRRTQTREDIERQRAIDEAEKRRGNRAP